MSILTSGCSLEGQGLPEGTILDLSVGLGTSGHLRDT